MPINPNLPIAKGTPFREILENFEYMLKALQSFAGRIWGNNASIRVDYSRTSYTATHALLISTCYLRVPHHVFFPVATSRQEHNWVGEASQSLQIQAAMVHGEVRKNLGKAEMCFAKQ